MNGTENEKNTFENTLRRINELAAIAKQRELTKEEAAERENLRRTYIDFIKGDLRSKLDSIVIQNPDGSKEKLKKKK